MPTSLFRIYLTEPQTADALRHKAPARGPRSRVRPGTSPLETGQLSIGDYLWPWVDLVARMPEQLYRDVAKLTAEDTLALARVLVPALLAAYPTGEAFPPPAPRAEAVGSPDNWIRLNVSAPSDADRDRVMTIAQDRGQSASTMMVPWLEMLAVMPSALEISLDKRVRGRSATLSDLILPVLANALDAASPGQAGPVPPPGAPVPFQPPPAQPAAPAAPSRPGDGRLDPLLLGTLHDRIQAAYSAAGVPLQRDALWEHVVRLYPDLAAIDSEQGREGALQFALNQLQRSLTA